MQAPLLLPLGSSSRLRAAPSQIAIVSVAQGRARLPVRSMTATAVSGSSKWVVLAASWSLLPCCCWAVPQGPRTPRSPPLPLPLPLHLLLPDQLLTHKAPRSHPAWTCCSAFRATARNHQGALLSPGPDLTLTCIHLISTLAGASKQMNH